MNLTNLKCITRADLYVRAITTKNGWRFGRSRSCPNRCRGKLMIHPLGALGCPVCNHLEVLDLGSREQLAVLAESAMPPPDIASHVAAQAERILSM